MVSGRGENSMTGLKRVAAILVALCVLCAVSAMAEGISTNVVIRVSRLAQDAIVDEGEDLSMEINVEGVQPTKYQWYFNDAPISGAEQKVYNIVNAAEEDAGVYRMDAFDESGSMVLSMDMAVRVIGKNMPQSGDSSLPLGAVLAAMAAAALLLVRRIRRLAA